MFRIRTWQFVRIILHDNITRQSLSISLKISNSNIQVPKPLVHDAIDSAMHISNLDLLGHSIPTPPANNRSKFVKHIWHWNHESANAAENGERPVNAHILIEGNSNDRHSSSSTIARNSHEAQCRSRVHTVRVNHVHVRTDEDADSTKTEGGRCNTWGPD